MVDTIPKVDCGPEPECWWTEYVRRNNDVPSEWKVSVLDGSHESCPEGYCKLTGYVPGRKKTTKAIYFVPRFAARDLRYAEAAKKGGCGNCWGSGKEFAVWSREAGVKHRTCAKCGGTGAVNQPSEAPCPI